MRMQYFNSIFMPKNTELSASSVGNILDAEQQRRKFESTQLKLQMLSRKIEDIKLDDYIKNLTIDHNIPKLQNNDQRFEPKLLNVKIPVQTSISIQNNESTGTGFVINPEDQEKRWDVLANQLSGVFETNELDLNSCNDERCDLPEIGYIGSSGTFPLVDFLPKPNWLTDFSHLPPIYHECIQVTTKNSSSLDSAVIYDLFQSSKLNTETLYHIWSLTSCSKPGLFNQTELVQALGLIGLAQRNQWLFYQKPIGQILTIQALYQQTCPPVPMVEILNHSVQLDITSTCNVPTIFNHAFQPPIVAFSTTNQTDCNPLGNCIGYEDHEWSDFTSFAHSGSNIGQTSPINHQINGSDSDQIRPTSMSTISENTLHLNTFDDDFGDFQTGNTHMSSSNSNFMDNSKSDELSKTNIWFKTQSYVDPLSGLMIIESLRNEWLRCLTQCLKLFRESLESLVLVDTVNYKQEFCQTDEGYHFLLDILEIYLMVKRINISARKYDVFNEDMEQEFLDIEENFGKLASYAVLPELKGRINHALNVIYACAIDGNNCILSYLSNVTTNTESICGVCLIPLEPSLSSSSSSPLSSSTSSLSRSANQTSKLGCISLAGRNYHASCANFWTNQIELSLPALRPPSLF